MKKNISRFIKTLLLLIIFSNNAFSQGQSTTQGKDFWLSFGQNYIQLVSDNMLQIRIVPTRETAVTLTFTADNSNKTFNVAAGQVYTHTFTAAEAAKIYSNASGTTNKSLHIVSDENISVFAINILKHTTDATNVLPVSNYGQSYRHISYKAVNGLGDGYTIVASENNTKVSENGTIVATLNKGQVYSKYTAGADLTGTLISSDNPIAYFTTNTCVNIPSPSGYCDCLFQQQAPVSSWGNKFLVPVTKRGIERVRIVASQDGTKITQTGGTVITDVGTGSLTLNAGQFVELEISLSNKGCYIVSDKPVAVASFLTGSSYLPNNRLGDPAMAWVPPIEQTVMNVAIAPFIAMGTSVLKEHYALIVTPTATKNSTTMTIGAGSPQALSGGTWTDNAASGYSFYSLQMDQQTSTYYFENAAGLTVMGYGLGEDESYYYLAASSARQLNPSFYINDIHFEDANGQTYCTGSFDIRGVAQMTLDPNPGAITWYIDGVEQVAARDQLLWTIPSLTLDTPHEITMIVKDIYNYVFTLTSIITVVDPQPLQITGNPYICSPATSTVLTAESGPARYQWYKDGTAILGATQNTYTITAANAGNYSVIGYYGTCVSPMSDTVTVINGCEPTLEVTYAGNGHTAGTAPVDTVIYVSGAIVTTQLHGSLVRTGGVDPILFAGWTPAPVTNVLTAATAADTTTAFVREGALFTITDHTTMYAVWSTDVNGNGKPDVFEDYYNVIYNDNGATSGTVPVDAADYLSGMSVTIKTKGTLVKDSTVFLGWSTSVVSVVTNAAQEAAANIIPADTAFVITGNMTLYAVWAQDTDGNEIPDYRQAVITYNKGAISATATNLPKTQIVAKGDTIALSTMGAIGRFYKLVGWNIMSVPLINSLTMENIVLKMGTFYALGAPLAITGDMTLYAVWVIDQNNDGKPDYAGSEFNQVGFRRGDANVFSGSATGNEAITDTRVWSYGNTLYIQSDKAVRANIYVLSGMLLKQLDAPEGITGEPLKRGIYIVEIDGSRYKVVVK